MKKLLSSFALLIFPFLVFGQGKVGVNELDPKTTLQISASDPANPGPDEGIIIPRVTNLNVNDPKEIGLLVFYESTNNDRGFYWWDGVTWQPFVSITQITADLTLSHAFCKTNFKEGDITENPDTNLRTLEFDGLTSNDTENYELNNAGELVVKRRGKYHIYGVVYVRNESVVVNAQKRDAIEAKLFINDSNASAKNGNLNIEGANGFPTGNFTIAVFLSGALKLDENDRLAFKVNRYYRDAESPITIRPDSESLSNLTLKYLGDF